MTQPDPVTEPTLGYASGIHPPAEAHEAGGSECVRDGDALVAFHGSTLPPHCVLCGNDAHGEPIKLTFTWDASFKVTQANTLQLRQQATLLAFLCRRHRARWAGARRMGGWGIAASILVMLCGLTMSVISERSDMPTWTPTGIGLTIAGFALLIFSLFFLALRSRTLSCRKIHEGYVYLDGASPEFLALLPQVAAPARDNASSP